MKNILCFGDSNTFGANPNNQSRWARDERWTGILQNLLGNEYYVIEEGLGGRTSCFDDPLTPDRNGIKVLPMLLECHQPLDLVIIMLGTNDTKTTFPATAKTIAFGVGKCVETIKNFKSYTHPEQKTEILIVSPIHQSENADECSGCITFEKSSYEKSLQLAAYLKTEAEKQGVHFFDAALVAGPGIDGIHLDKKDHKSLAIALAKEVEKIFHH